MTIIVGLGNPGEKYRYTRHNAGWMAIDVLASKLGLRWQTDKKHQAEVARGSDHLLIKPTTFMNESGLAAASIMRYYQLEIEPNEIVVMHDDLDLELGSFKLQQGIGPKVHNGLQSLYDHLKTKDFWHARIGIDGRQGDRSLPGSAYVLQQFSSVEQEQLQKTITDLIAKLNYT